VRGVADMQYDIFAVGDNVADYYPEQKRIYAGGGAYNTAVIGKRLNLKTAYYGAFGTDENAKFMYNTLKKEKVAYPVSDIRKGRNAVSIVEKNSGEANIKAVDKGVYKNLSLNENVLDLIKKSKIVHTNIYSYFEDYLAKLHYQTKLSFDFSYLRNKARQKEDQTAFIDWALQQGPEVVVLTRGGNSALLKSGQIELEIETQTIKTVDTLGAGDAFISAFLTSLIRDFKPDEPEKYYQLALKKAEQIAAKYCQINGSLGIFADRQEDVIIYNNIHA
jgi:fructoselysine 6-kinase